jgi:polyisoprenoid-binding protein YceI
MLVKSLLALSLATAAALTFSQSEAPPARPGGDGAFQIDAVHSSVNFRVKHLGVSYNYGRFNSISGTVNFDEKAPEKSSIEVEIKSESVDTNNPGRDKHLKSPDFFNAKQFPTITFKSTSVKKTADRMLEVTGDLTLHGVTKSIKANAEMVGSAKDPRGGGLRTGFDAMFKVKRSDFDMKFMLDGIGDEVDIHMGLEAVRGGKN